jgi:hypothetical protein
MLKIWKKINPMMKNQQQNQREGLVVQEGEIQEVPLVIQKENEQEQARRNIMMIL